MATGWLDLPIQGGDGNGILSINGDDSSAQEIVGGTGISVATTGGVTTVTNTGGGGGSGDSFVIMQPVSGTAPTATGSADTLTFLSSGSTVSIAGDSGAKTLDFNVIPIPFNPTLSTGSSLFEDFNSFNFPDNLPFGGLNLNITGTAAEDHPTSAETNRYGIALFSDSTGQPCGFSTALIPIYGGSSTQLVAMAFQIGSNLPTGPSNSWVAAWGIGNDYPGDSDGCYFSMNYLSPNFQCISYDGAETQVDSGVPYAANTWYNFRIINATGSAQFFIDGVLVATITTTLPNAGTGNVFSAFTNQTGAGVMIRCDWVYMKFTPNVPRGVF